MKKIFFILTCGLIFSIGANNAIASDIEQEIKICSKIENSIERLDCYDKIVKDNTKNTVTTSDNWTIQKGKSKFTDTEQIYLITEATKPIKSMFGQNIFPILILRCQDNKTDVIIDWDTFLGIESVKVTERIDKEKVQTTDWSISTDNKATFRRQPIKFIKRMLNKEKLLVQVVPYGENPVTTEFNIHGLENIIEPLQKMCNWK